MTRTDLPSRDLVLATAAQLQRETGHPPATLALARRLGLSNTTFRRNFPDVVLQLSQQAAAHQHDPPPGRRREDPQQASAELRRANRELRHHLDLATAVIQRLTLENHHLRQQLEASANITRIGPPARAPEPARPP